jgi:hypothetical protein
VPVHVHRLDDNTVFIEVGDIDGESHPESVHPATAFQNQGSLDAVAAEQTTAPRHAVGR